ncbi:MAG: peroxiredoxin [Bacteroidota bacterium]
MQKSVIFILFVFLCSAVSAQSNKETKIPMIGDDAPAFVAETTNGKLNFPGDYGKKWKIILSHPRDFTPVCTSEILQLGYMQNEFDDLNTKIVVVSTDTKERHEHWINAMEELAQQNHKPLDIKFPLVDDSKMTVASSYGMLHNRTSTTENVRGVYFICPENKIRASVFYPMSVGRNMSEIKRTLLALQTAEETSLLTPANWNPGDDLLVPHYPYTDRELARDPSIKDHYYQVGNLMWFKKSE